MCKSAFQNLENARQNYRKLTYCRTLLHIHSHHPLSCKEYVIYSQVLQYNMIIYGDHILQEELNNLTGILLVQHIHYILSLRTSKLHPRELAISTDTTHRKKHSSYCYFVLRYRQIIHSQYS